MNNDLISRQDAIISLVYADETSYITCGDMANVVRVLQRIPSAQSNQKTGKWIYHETPDKYYKGFLECPFCGWGEIESGEIQYCARCGAYLRRGDNDG